MSILIYNEISQKKIQILNIYLDKIMKITESQYGYIIQVKNSENDELKFQKVIEMYLMPDIKMNIPLDANFDFLEDVNSTLEFWNRQIIETKKPLIMNQSDLLDNLFTFDNQSILNKSSWFILPIHHFTKTVAIMGLIGSPISFNPYYFEMLQPFMILCSEMLVNGNNDYKTYFQ